MTYLFQKSSTVTSSRSYLLYGCWSIALSWLYYHSYSTHLYLGSSLSTSKYLQPLLLHCYSPLRSLSQSTCWSECSQFSLYFYYHWNSLWKYYQRSQCLHLWWLFGCCQNYCGDWYYCCVRSDLVVKSCYCYGNCFSCHNYSERHFLCWEWSTCSRVVFLEVADELHWWFSRAYPPCKWR